MVTLVVTSGPSAGERFELTDDLIIGREDGDLIIGDPEISRRHAVIRTGVAGGASGVEIEDLGSTNGTFVNGSRIDGPVALEDGVRVGIGDTVIVVDAPAADRGATRVRVQPDARDVTQVRSAIPAPTTETHEVPQQAPAAMSPEMPAAAAPPLAVQTSASSAAVAEGQPFGAFMPSGARTSRRARVASRLWVPAGATFAIISGVAIALIVYFADR